MKRALQVAWLGLSLPTLAGACASNGPENPTWADDIHPLMVARCIRCHDDPGQIDPATAATGVPILQLAATPSFNYANFSDIPAGSLTFLTMAAKYARGAVGSIPRMPPLPAAELADWQIDTLDRWGKNPK